MVPFSRKTFSEIGFTGEEWTVNSLRPKSCMLVADLKLNALSCSLGTLWKTLAMPKALETMAVAFPCSLAVLKARSRSRPTRSLDRSIECCCRAIDSAWSSRTRSRIGLTFLSKREAQASAELPLLQLGLGLEWPSGKKFYGSPASQIPFGVT